MRKLIITLELLDDTDVDIVREEFQSDILPDYADLVKSIDVRVEGGEESGKEK